MIAINAGSGQRKFGPPFTNIDINPKWEPDLVADCAHLPMYEDGTVDLIVSHQNCEHYGCGEARVMVEECYRILKPGCSFIVSVPDMRALAKMWLRGDISTQIYLTSVYGAYMDHPADRHAWGFDDAHLREFLSSCCPWKTITSFDYRHIPGASIAKDTWILCLEAIK